MTIQELPPRSCFNLREADPSILHLDVRTPEEFARGHPEGAWNVPFLLPGAAGLEPNPRFARVVQRLLGDKAARVILSCGAGGRSQRACQALAELGYQAPISMLGGFEGARDGQGDLCAPGWQAEGLPESTEAGERGWETLGQS